MMFSSNAHALIRQVTEGAAVSANQARKEAVAKRLDLYQDQQLAHLITELERRYADPSKLSPAFMNIVKKVIDCLAAVYVEPATRTIEGGDKDQEIFSEIAEQTGLDAKLKQASRLTKLTKTMLLRPVWRNGSMDIDLLTGNILDIETGDSPEDFRAILVTHFGESSRVTEVEYSHWTAETYRRLDYRGRVLEEEPNPYLILPFVPCWDGLPSGDFWLSGGDDLVALQAAINEQLTSLLYTTRMQGHGVGWVKGQGQGGEITAGPGAMIELGPDGELGFAATKAPISEILETIDWLIKTAAVSNGLPASSLSTKVTEESGISKLVGNSELQERRRDDVGLWRKYEHELFDVIRVVWNVQNPTRRISDKATLKIDFADPKPVVSEKERTENQERLLDLGQISPVDIAMQRNPDLATREDALAYLLQIQDETAQLNEREL